MTTRTSASGIVTDETSGERHIPESRRADGSTRKAKKIRPGYLPPEDVQVYKNRAAENFRNRGKGPIPGAEGLKDDKPALPSANAIKNAKRREAQKKAAASDEGQAKQAPAQEAQEEVDPETKKEKQVRNLKKKLKQAKELKEKKETGKALLPEQIAKVIKMNELIRELDALGFDAEGEPKVEGAGEPKAEEVGELKGEEARKPDAADAVNYRVEGNVVITDKWEALC